MESVAANPQSHDISQVMGRIGEKRKTLALKPGQRLKDHKTEGQEQSCGQAKLGTAP